MTRREKVSLEEAEGTIVRGLVSDLRKEKMANNLGKRALALFLKHNSVLLRILYISDYYCLECGEVEHTSECEWGKLVTEAKALG